MMLLNWLEQGEKQCSKLVLIIRVHWRQLLDWSLTKLKIFVKKPRLEGIVQCANFNSPGQIVISGSIPGVRKAMELCKV